MSLCVIMAAGVGSRMGNDCAHKALMPLKGKAIISYLIERSNSDKIVIAVGYKKQQIIDYVSCVHPDKNCIFVNVENFDGPGSGPGHSMECCRSFMNEPFYLLTSDSYVEEDLPPITQDWIGVFKSENLQNYSTCSIDENSIVNKFKNKSLEPLEYAFSGIMAVKNHQKFWEKFDQYKKERKDKEVEAIGVLYEPFYAPIHAKNLKYNDTGTKKMYDQLYEQVGTFSSYELKKENVDEVTYKIDNKIIKLGDCIKIALKKQKHNLIKNWCTPMLSVQFENLLCCEYAEGYTLYDVDNENIYTKFLEWLEAGLFRTKAERPENYLSTLEKFYKNKTLERVNAYLSKNKISKEKKFKINGMQCDSFQDVLDGINWFEICNNPIDSVIHGDLNFGNVIIGSDRNFHLIDWRDSFDGHVNWGDRYYDYAKIYAGCAINFKMLSSSNNPFEKMDDSINLKSMMSPACEAFLERFENYLLNKKININKVRTLAFLSYLNMSPLHPSSFGDFLAYYGIYKLCHERQRSNT